MTIFEFEFVLFILDVLINISIISEKNKSEWSIINFSIGMVLFGIFEIIVSILLIHFNVFVLNK